MSNSILDMLTVYPRIIKSYKNISFMEISREQFVVKKKGFFSNTFFCFNRNGLDICYDSLVEEITITTDRARAELVFNAQVIKRGR